MRLSCSFLLMCSGYYRYDEGYTPDFQGTERFAGRIVHPQQWTEDIDYAGKRVVVIGSGATAVTPDPRAGAERGARHDAAALAQLHRLAARGRPDRQLPAPRAAGQGRLLDRALEERPADDAELPAQPAPAGGWSRPWSERGVEKRLPPGYDIDTHFKPRYGPWDQRLCLVPDGDLFEAICAGRASVVTDQIDTFTEKGIGSSRAPSSRPI